MDRTLAVADCGSLRTLCHIRDFFFDLDGTLADSASGLSGSIEVAFASVGRPMPVQDVAPFIGPGIRTILANMDSTLSQDQIDQMEQAFRADYDAQGVLRTEMFEGTTDVLAALRQTGARLFVVTNKPRLATSRLLAKQGLSSIFTDIVSRNSREPAFRSKGEMLVSTMQTHDADPGTSLMIGDTAEDAEAAHEAGVAFAHASYGYGQCDVAVVTLGAIRDLLTHCLPTEEIDESARSKRGAGER